jgi:hypothetical protein
MGERIVPFARYRFRSYDGTLPVWLAGVPTSESTSNVIRVKPQMLADVFEGEQPMLISCPKPRLSFLKQSSPTSVPCMTVPKPTGHSVLKNCK